MPQALQRLTTLPVRSEPARDALTVEPVQSIGAGDATARPDIERHPQQPEPRAEGQTGEAQQPGDQTQGMERQGRKGEGRLPPTRIEERDAQMLLEAQSVVRAYPLEKTQGVAVAADE